MTKRELDFIVSAVDTNNPKIEFNYAIFDFKNNHIYATDTRRLLKFYYDFEGDNDKDIVLAHPRILRAISGLLDSDNFDRKLSDSITFKNNCAYMKEAYFSLDHLNSMKDLPEFEKVLETGRRARPKKVPSNDITFYIHNKGIRFEEFYMKSIKEYFSFFHDIDTYIHTGKPDEPFMIEGRKGKKTIFEYVVMPTYF